MRDAVYHNAQYRQISHLLINSLNDTGKLWYDWLELSLDTLPAFIFSIRPSSDNSRISRQGTATQVETVGLVDSALQHWIMPLLERWSWFHRSKTYPPYHQSIHNLEDYWTPSFNQTQTNHRPSTKCLPTERDTPEIPDDTISDNNKGTVVTLMVGCWQFM
jgi:hypothetical protein